MLETAPVLSVMFNVTTSVSSSIPVTASAVSRLPVTLVLPAPPTSVIAPVVEVMVTSPKVASALELALSTAIATLPGAQTVMSPSSLLKAEPRPMETTPVAVPSPSAAASVQSSPARATMAPVPAALTVLPATTSMLSPAYRLMLPSPPVAVTLALMVRSSAAVAPMAARVISPPPVLLTAAETVSGLAAVMRMSSPTAPPVMFTPLRPAVLSAALTPVTPRPSTISRPAPVVSLT